MSKKVTVIERVAMIVLLLSPILWIYGIPEGLNSQRLCTRPLSFLYFLSYFFTTGSIIGKRDPLPYGIMGYFIYWVVLYVVTSMQFPLGIIEAYLAFFLFSATFNREYFIKIYRAFALICIVFFFLQEISYFLTNVRISGVISFLPKSGDISMGEYMMIKADSSRFSSFFSEPAHFAQFLLPLLAIELFYDKSKIRIPFAIAIGVTMLFTHSGNALLGMAAVLLFYVPYYLRNARKYRWLGFLAIIFIIGIAGYYYLKSEMGASTIERQNEMKMVYEGGNRSGFLRIWRGLYVYGDYSPFEKLLGSPNPDVLLEHVYTSDMQIVKGSEFYFSAFWRILLNTGLIGLGIFIYVIVRLWRGNNVCGKAILALFIVLSFIANIYMSSTMILFMVLVKSMKTAPREK